MPAPFFTAISALAGQGGRFHVPGHKGNPNAIPPFGGILPYDLTEIPGADDLSNPSGPLAASQAAMARLYGSGATLYSAGGSTSCIQAMLTVFLRPGGTVVAGRNCHVSLVRGLAFLGANARWVLPQNGRLPPQEAEQALAETGARALYVTSPDYYGRISDIAALAAVCRRHGAALLVDNAHGAHLRFLPGPAGQPCLHPLALGADATADSAHKTLPCLTPAALLHLQNPALAPAARTALNLYSSTSPSYPVLQSLDLAAALLADAPPDFPAAARRLAAATAAAPHLFDVSDDPLKACLRPALGGWEYAPVHAALTNAGITPELADGERIVLMASPWNTEEDFAALAAAIAPFSQKTSIKLPETPLSLPNSVCSIREAVFGESCRLPVAAAVGRVVAGVYAPCPPGIPVALPGEALTPTAAQQLAAGGILAVDVLK